MDNITTRVSFWVITTAIDFQPYEIALSNVLTICSECKVRFADQSSITSVTMIIGMPT